MEPLITFHVGRVIPNLETIPDSYVDTAWTSPPYWKLRDYGHPDQLGQERTPEEYVANLVEVFRELRRTLSDSGSLWLNLGDTYLKKELLGLPWRVALALQADGWHLRSDIIWEKTNVLPSSVKDRPVTSHEYLFLLTKSFDYFYDREALREPAEWARWGAQRTKKVDETGIAHGSSGHFKDRSKEEIQATFGKTRNGRTVWRIPTVPFKKAHFATAPPELVRRCLRATCPSGGMVLDPFVGAGTTSVIAQELGLSSIGIDLKREYIELAKERLLEKSKG